MSTFAWCGVLIGVLAATVTVGTVALERIRQPWLAGAALVVVLLLGGTLALAAFAEMAAS